MPHLHLSQHSVLEGATFALVEARVDWGGGLSSTGWGRDRDLDVASWKAVHEAIERHAYAVMPAHARRCPASGLPAVLDTHALVSHAPWQQADPALGLRLFRPEESCWWLQARPVRAALPDEAGWVLADVLLSPRAFDADYRARLVTHASSSGFASAATLDDAVVHATLELIERDAMMRHWFAQRPGLQVDQKGLPSELHARFAVLEEAGCLVGLQRLDLGVHPVWLAWAQHPVLHFTSVGSACALDGTAALESALGELETQVLARVAGVLPETIKAVDVRTPADHAALYATKGYFRCADRLLCPGAVPVSGYQEALAAFACSAAELYDSLESRGCRPWWVDLTPPEARSAFDGRTVHTVRAVVPHLIPMSFGWRRQPAGMDRWHCADADAVHPYS